MADAGAGVGDGNDRTRSSGGGAYSDPPDHIRRPQHPGHHERAHAGHTYEADRGQQFLMLILGTVTAAIGIGALAVGEIPGLLLLAGAAWVLFLGLWMPHRVTLDDDGVRIEGIWRQVRIPWDDLRAVASPVWDFQHLRLRWQRRRGLGVSTPQAFPELHRMLVEIEHRAPHVYVEA